MYYCMCDDSIAMFFVIFGGFCKIQFLLSKLLHNNHAIFADFFMEAFFFFFFSPQGVCAQTHAVFRQARAERMRPLLVLNKVCENCTVAVCLSVRLLRRALLGTSTHRPYNICILRNIVQDTKVVCISW